MLNKTQQSILNTLKVLWETRPEERFSQLLFNYTRFQSGMDNGKINDIFFYEDDDILQDLRINLRADKIL